ncbi:MAG: hypothetical protein OWQ54_08015 [Sulfolobaceae archaeon]|nr:hypothetical protein [Sulfolobaceae archaeon]
MKILTKFSEYLKNAIIYYGGDYSNLIRKYKGILIKFLPPIVATQIILFFLYLHHLLFLPLYLVFSPLFLAETILIIEPFIITWSNREEFKKMIEKELPFFVIIMYLNSLMNKGILETLTEIAKNKVLKSIQIEYNMVRKEMEIFGRSLFKSLEKRALLHNNDNLGKFLLNYLTVAYTGAGIKETLREEMKIQLNLIHEQYKNYINKSAEFVELIFSLYLLVPLILLGFSFTFKVNVIFFFIPLLFTPAIYLLISSQQPDVGYQMNFSYKDLIPLPLSLLVMFIPILNIVEKISVAIFINIVFLVKKYLRIYKDEKILEELPLILREVADYSRLGYSIRNTLLKIPIEKYSKETQELIKRIRKNIISNKKLGKINSSIWLIDIIFTILELVDMIGGETYTVVTELSNILISLIDERRKLINELRPYSFLAYMTPFLLWFTLGTFSNISTDLSLLPVLQSIIILYSILIAVIFSKISKFTIINVPLLSIVALESLILSMLPLRLI